MKILKIIFKSNKLSVPPPPILMLIKNVIVYVYDVINPYFQAPGQCLCKNKTTGRQCKRCVDGYYNLTAENPQGCLGE